MQKNGINRFFQFGMRNLEFGIVDRYAVIKVVKK